MKSTFLIQLFSDIAAGDFRECILALIKNEAVYNFINNHALVQAASDVIDGAEGPAFL